MTPQSATRWLRRARPLLGTLVEVGVYAPGLDRHAAIDAAFAVVSKAQACMSRFDPTSDVARFNALHNGECLSLRPITRQVLAAAHELRAASSGNFDISLGSAPDGWVLRGARLHKLIEAARIDLGGLGKGHAVDLAVNVLLAHGVPAGWVNAGGDLRAFGDVAVPVRLRDEATGGARDFATLRDGAFATSDFGVASHSRLAVGAAPEPRRTHVSVAAPLCLWADALTKIVALSADTSHPMLARYGAAAWVH